MGTLALGSVSHTSSAEVQGLPTGRSEEIPVSTSDGAEADSAALLSGHPPPLQNKPLLPINAGLSINKCLLSFLGDDKQPQGPVPLHV